MLSSNCYNAGYSHEIRSVTVLQQIVGNKYSKYSTGIFFPVIYSNNKLQVEGLIKN